VVRGHFAKDDEIVRSVVAASTDSRRHFPTSRSLRSGEPNATLRASTHPQGRRRSLLQGQSFGYGRLA